ncbi:hypothetical protein ACE1CD_01520 [Aerosakkonema sp. BLCC-F183]|uniref:hypothetical protein n=1 Tax=Aerosakkonema sp. BLCC-F183 TaxID=3342834 RepID=UPI0035BB028F
MSKLKELKKPDLTKFVRYQNQGKHRTIHNVILFWKVVGISCTGIVSVYSSNAVLSGTITATVWIVCEIVDAQFAKHNEDKYDKIAEVLKKIQNRKY